MRINVSPYYFVKTPGSLYYRKALWTLSITAVILLLYERAFKPRLADQFTVFGYLIPSLYFGWCSCNVMSNSLRPYGLYPTRLLCSWDFPSKNTGVCCHFLLQGISTPRDWTWVSCIASRFFTNWATWEGLTELYYQLKCSVQKNINSSTATFSFFTPQTTSGSFNHILLSIFF